MMKVSTSSHGSKRKREAAATAAERRAATAKIVAGQKCSICLEDNKLEHATGLNNCQHVFCFKCIETWKNSDRSNKNMCPVCRTTFTTTTQLLNGTSTTTVPVLSPNQQRPGSFLEELSSPIAETLRSFHQTILEVRTMENLEKEQTMLEQQIKAHNDRGRELTRRSDEHATKKRRFAQALEQRRGFGSAV
jgi:hypothetical protein